MSNMVVNTNVLSLNAHRSMKRVGTKQDRSSAKLSSGERINTSADDAAGLAISEKMRAQIRGINRGTQNTQDGINLSNVADGGLQEVSNMLQRMRELTIQSANDTYTVSDREKIQLEIDQLASGIDSISDNAQFNKINVLNSPTKVIEDNSVTNTTINTINSTETENVRGAYYYEVKGTTEYTNTSSNTETSWSSSFTYTESEECLGKVSEIADDYVPRLTDGDWKDYYLNESTLIATSTNVIDNQTITDSLEKVAEPELSLSKVGSNGEPIFYATASTTTPTGYPIEMGYQLNYSTDTLFRNNTTGKITSLYDTNSTQTVAGNTITNVFDPIDGVQITQSITMDSTGYKINFTFENVSGGDVDFDLKFSSDTLEEYNGVDPITGTIDNPLAELKITGDADNTYFGSVNSLNNSFDVTTYNDFLNTNLGVSMIWSNTLTAGQTSTGVVNYGVELGCDLYYEHKEIEHSYDTTTTAIEENISQITIPTQLAIQTGANAGEIMGIRLYDISCVDMGLFYIDGDGNKIAGVNVLSNDDCQQSLETLDRTLGKVSSYRAYFGAKMNRMEHTIKANDISSENLSASESRIRDTDMAKEMMELTKSNILQSAAMNMLSQANQSTLNLLQILK